MSTTLQNRFTSQTRPTTFTTPCFAFLETDFTALTTTDLTRRTQTFEREFCTACPRDFARSVATGLARRPGADSATRLEAVLREFTKPVVQELVVRLNHDCRDLPPTVAAVCVYGKDIRFEGYEAIERANAELSRRTAAEPFLTTTTVAS
jgi:hypothetical protein